MFLHSRTFELFSFLGVTNRAAINPHVQVSAWTGISFSLGQTPKSEVAGCSDNCVLVVGIGGGRGVDRLSDVLLQDSVSWSFQQ